MRQHVSRLLLFLPPPTPGVVATGAASGTRFAIHRGVFQLSRTYGPRTASQCVAYPVVRDRFESVRTQVAGLRECSAIVVDNSGAAAIIGVSGLYLDSEGAPAVSDKGGAADLPSGRRAETPADVSYRLTIQAIATTSEGETHVPMEIG